MTFPIPIPDTTTFLTILTVVVIIGGIICFHELGHFLAARFFGIGVQKFSLGLGPKLVGVTVGKTTYQIAPVPLGGYVMLVGEEDGAELPAGFTEKENFAARPSWQKLLVVLAGPAFNILLGWILATGLLWHYGDAKIIPEIGTVKEESPAAKAGLKKGDTIVKIGNQNIQSWEEVPLNIVSAKGAPVEITVKRKIETGTELTSVTITPKKEVIKNLIGRMQTAWIIGISPAEEPTIISQSYSFTEAAQKACSKVWGYIAAIGNFLGDAAKMQVEADSLVGPIGIAQIIAKLMEAGLRSLLEITIFISINLGILNLLPIPILDGGSIVFFGLETITRKKLPANFKQKATAVGLILLVCLMAFTLFNDIAGIIRSK